MLRPLFLCLSLGFGLLVAAEPAAPVPVLRVVALHPILAEFARELGGDAVAVDCLLPQGTDPHEFNPVPADVRRLAQADLVLSTGLGLEPYLDRLVQNSGFKGRQAEAAAWVAKGGTALQARVRQQDPHWWHSIEACRCVVAGLAETLALARPEAADRIHARAQVLDTRLAALKDWALEQVVSLPEDHRILVSDHDAFGYLADELGLQVRSLSGVSTESETDARSLAALIRFIREKRIRTVFAENTENPRLLAGMLRESGAVLGGTLFADGPGLPGGEVSGFEGMYRSNLKTLIQGLR